MVTSFTVLFILAYIAGALPWSVWLGRWFFQIDPRGQTDGNPGAANAFRTAGWRLGIPVLLLDFFKAFIPVFIARWGLRLPEQQLVWVALMPTIGHAFSIFLRFRGGRAIVTWFGVWSGLTLYEVPLVIGGAAIAASLVSRNVVYRTLVVPLALFAYLLLRGEPLWMLALGAAQLLILLLKMGVFHSVLGVSPADRRSRLKS